MSESDIKAGSGSEEAAWQMACTRDLLQQRAQLYGSIRHYFAQLGVLEVDTPALSHTAACDLNIESISTEVKSAFADKLFLQSSPEYAMKRLLASGSGPIFQIAHAFRAGESGRYHNPEFALLEWYQPGYSLSQLMDETRDLILECLGQSIPVLTLTYADLFQSTLGVDPHTASISDLAELAARHGLHDAESVCENRLSDWLDFLFSELVQTGMRSGVLYLVQDYPACQAMLAKVRSGSSPVAERFEVFLNGIELANGFHELTDAEEQAKRFEQVLAQRALQGSEGWPMPQHLIEALRQGLPESCGVAVGLDRLLMLISGADHIDQVLSFPLQRA